MTRNPHIIDCYVIMSASDVMSNDNMQSPTELVSRTSGLDDKSIAFDQQTKLMGMRVTRTI